MINEIILNLYAQNKISREKIEEYFETLNESERGKFTDKLLILAYSSNVNENQLETALENSGYRNTINYYNLLKSKRNIFRNNLVRIKKLGAKPFRQGFVLLLELFREAYKNKEDWCNKYAGKCNHWWHKDLSNIEILNKIFREYFANSVFGTEKAVQKVKEILEK